jgi:predicted phosphoserine aminotransferase
MSLSVEPRTPASTTDATSSFGRFFLPGPTEVRHDVLRAMTRQMIGHRGADIEGLLARSAPKLSALFRTSRPVYTATSSATGLMEAGLRNVCLKRALCLINGAFSERFFKAAKNSGIPVEKLEVPPGQIHTPDMLADALKKGDYDCVTMVHSETSTGALNPIRELTEAAHAAGDVLVVVDTVSSMGAAPVETDAWTLDYVLTGSQKAIAVPPGLAFCSANERAFERARASTNRGLYFDLIEFDDYFKKNQTPNTPAVSLLYALDTQLDHIMSEGIEARWARHQAMAERTWRWVDETRERGAQIGILAPEGYRAQGVTCIAVPPGKTGSEIVSATKKRGFVIASGYGKMKDQMVRVGHMGDHTMAELEALLEVLTDVITK